jgi:geranylgeranyl diphosphate synthase, type III
MVVKYQNKSSVDDIDDNSTIRKNKPAAHLVFGVPFTFNSIRLSSYLILKETMKLSPKRGAEIYVDSMLKYARGTGLEIYWRNNHICPSTNEYLNHLVIKNGGYFYFLARLVQTSGESKLNFGNVTALSTLFYSIRNDYNEFFEGKADSAEGKKFCDDLTEGKYTLPTVHAIRVKGCREVSGTFFM